MIRAGLSFSFVSYVWGPFYHRLDPARFLQHPNTLRHHATPQSQGAACQRLVHEGREIGLHLPSTSREVDRHPQLHLDLHLMHVPTQQLL